MIYPEKVLRGVDCLLIVNPVNIRYLTGFIGAAPSEHEVFLLITSAGSYLFTNSLYLERATELSSKYDTLKVIKISRDHQIMIALSELFRKLKLEKIGFEANDLTFAEYIDFVRNLKQIKLIPTANRIEEMRMLKTNTEIRNIRKAAQITDKCLGYIKTKIKPGVTEAALAAKIEMFFKAKHAETAFAPIVAFGANSSQPHYIPAADCRLKSGNMILFDIGAKYNGYCADMTRMVFTASPSAEIVKAYNAVLSAQFKSINSITKFCGSRNFLKEGGFPGSDIDRIAKAEIKKSGFPPYSHSLGHNVGLSIHENPRLSVKTATRIKPGMVFTIEPATYLPGKFEIRIEDLVYLDETGLEILSQSPKNIDILKI